MATGLLDPTALNPNVSASTRSVSNDELSSYQMEKITGKDSVMKQRSEAYGKNYATSRGLLDSSIGAQATFGAFVDRAAPLAMADADRYGAVADQNLSYENQFKMSDKNFAQQGLLQKDNQAFTAGESVLDRTWRSGENTLDRTLTTTEAEKNRTLEKDIQTSDQGWRSGESALDRAQQNQTLTSQQDFAASQSALDRDLSREEIESRERIDVERSKAEIEKLGYTLQLDQMQLNASTQNQIQMSLLQQIMAIQSDGNLDPGAKEGAIANAMDAATKMAKTIADAMKTPVVPTASTFNSSRASEVLVDEAAKLGFSTPSMQELNAALEYAKANNLNEQQMRAYVRDTIAANNAPAPSPAPAQTPSPAQPVTAEPVQQAPDPAPQGSGNSLIDLAAQYGYNATAEEAALVASMAAQRGVSAEQIVMEELRARGLA